MVETLDLHTVKSEFEQIVDIQHGEQTHSYRVSRAGTYFSTKTHQTLIYVLDNLISGRRDNRVLLLYGDNQTRSLWGDADRCYLGRSTGTVKSPLVVYTKRSCGGAALLDDCICGIYESRKPYNSLWVHPNWSGVSLRNKFEELRQTKQLYIRG